MSPHPEGGYYKEYYRSKNKIKSDSLAQIHTAERSLGTGIYYLLREKNKSNFHRLLSEEIWHHIDGCSVHIHTLDENGSYKLLKLGKNLVDSEKPQIVIPALTWFAAELSNKNSYSLVGCTVIPGFDFEDFELADKSKLIEDYPQHKILIDRLTS